jgi:hypothetical protein
MSTHGFGPTLRRDIADLFAEAADRARDRPFLGFHIARERVSTSSAELHRYDLVLTEDLLTLAARRHRWRKRLDPNMHHRPSALRWQIAPLPAAYRFCTPCEKLVEHRAGARVLRCGHLPGKP